MFTFGELFSWSMTKRTRFSSVRISRVMRLIGMSQLKKEDEWRVTQAASKRLNRLSSLMILYVCPVISSLASIANGKHKICEMFTIRSPTNHSPPLPASESFPAFDSISGSLLTVSCWPSPAAVVGLLRPIEFGDKPCLELLAAAERLSSEPKALLFSSRTQLK